MASRGGKGGWRVKKIAYEYQKGKRGPRVFLLGLRFKFSKSGGGRKTRRRDLALELELDCTNEKLKFAAVEFH